MMLTWIDWGFLAVLAVSTLAGFMRGLVREGLGLAAWIIALLAARLLAEPVADLLSGLIDNPDGRLVLAFVLVILGVVLLCGIVIRMVHAAVEWVGMGFFNRVAGACFGVTRGAAILVVATILISLTPLAQLQAWQNAELRPTFEQLRDWAVSQLEAWEGRVPEAPEGWRNLSLPERRDAGTSEPGAQ
ncbi:CvpA family protein [Halomonas sp. MCCC 1A17488]|uniref:CvpA family protein n=1 Tax=unclassified Halomonas TaxID=2609666 RepID=UPI0018D272E2|nr:MULTISPECIES: CvpA family protein [unclassified Halomonas]MCE8014744.1 CvpA family protein [Halomonas sp. MCCC 1A17488]MCG3238077.1 CvpA family protein [Halomonas sp. MCCC 1A17488]QPP48148.1 CvpA family protein [Halomonas sp. SS10-MC5]